VGRRTGRGPRSGIQRIHADAVAEQGAAGLAARRIDSNDGDVEMVVLVEAEAAHDFVGDAGLARAAGAGDAEDGDVAQRLRTLVSWL